MRRREGWKRVREGPRLGVCSVCSPVDSAPGTRLQATSICRIPSILSLRKHRHGVTHRPIPLPPATLLPLFPQKSIPLLLLLLLLVVLLLPLLLLLLLLLRS